MKQSLISPDEIVRYISNWIENPDTSSQQKYLPQYTTIENAARIAEVVVDGSQFPVALPLFWTACDDGIVADQWYYDTQTTDIIVIPAPPPYPA